MKTSELTGAALNWAVAKCEGHDTLIKHAPLQVMYEPKGKRSWYVYRPESNWAQGGPIIEREMIDLQPVMRLHTKDVHWRACGAFMSSTPLIAAMRCFVASRLGDDVDVPKELT